MSSPSGDQVGRIIAAWQRERPDVDVSSVGIITPVWRLGAIVMENRARVLAAHGLEQSHLDVLSTLRRSGRPYRLTAGELSRRCRVTPGATTQRVQAMEALGFVERVREEPDRRTVHVQLTPQGLARLDGIFAEVMAGDESLLVGLSQPQRVALEELLRVWLSGLDDRATAPRREVSPAPEDDELVGGARHRDVALDGALDAATETLRLDEDDEVELQALRQHRRQ